MDLRLVLEHRFRDRKAQGRREPLVRQYLSAEFPLAPAWFQAVDRFFPRPDVILSDRQRVRGLDADRRGLGGAQLCEPFAVPPITEGSCP